MGTPLLRFAPSPTGPLHLGGLRTALVNQLFARKHAGKWILRIEDTDATRYVPGSVENIQKSLAWAGLEYDYGPGVGGPHGPYFQSQRLDLYRERASHLLETGHAYRCFCTPDQLAEKKAHLQKRGSTATYDRACTRLTEEEVGRRVRVKERYVIRIDDSKSRKLPPFVDLVFLDVRDASQSLPTDPILLKSDQFPTYHLANVVDDHEMGVTHVLRGEEWLPSLPLHRDLYDRFGWTPPVFGHLPLLLNHDGSKMSKRKGDVKVQDYIERQWEPEGLILWLGTAGRRQEGPEEGEIKTVKDLEHSFDLAKYTHRRTILNPGKLKHFNRASIERKIASRDGGLINRAREVVATAYPNGEYTDEYIVNVMETLGDRLGRLDDLVQMGWYFFDRDPAAKHPPHASLPPELYGNVLSVFARKLRASRQMEAGLLSELLRDGQGEMGVTVKDFIGPLRHALTGEKVGPSMVEVMLVLGKGQVLSRLDGCIAKLQSV